MNKFTRMMRKVNDYCKENPDSKAKIIGWGFRDKLAVRVELLTEFQIEQFKRIFGVGNLLVVAHQGEMYVTYQSTKKL